MNIGILSVFLNKLGLVAPVGGAGPKVAAAGRALTVDDNNTTIVYTGAGAANFTVPKDMPAGFTVDLVQGAAGVLTVVAASAVTVAGVVGAKSAGLNSVVTVKNTATNKYAVTGDTAA